MTRKLIKNYTQNLKRVRDAKQGKVSNQTLAKIKKVIELYEDRKTSQFTTAVNLINNMTTGTAKSKEKGMKAYEKAVAKYEDKAPITERMKATVKKARKGKEVKEVLKKLKSNPSSKEKQSAEYQAQLKTCSRTGRITTLNICCILLKIVQALNEHPSYWTVGHIIH